MILWSVTLAVFFIFMIMCVISAVKKAAALFCESKRRLYFVTALLSAVIALPVFRVLSLWMITAFHFMVFYLSAKPFSRLLKSVKSVKSHKAFKYIDSLSIIPILCTAAVTLYGYFNIHNLVETDYTLITQKELSKDYCAVLLSDIHYGTTVHKEYINKLVRKVNQKNPDVILLCGDIVDERTSYAQMKEIFSLLSNMKSKYGIYFVYGNHDRSVYTSSPSFTDAQLKSAIESNNISILKDQSLCINGEMILIGRDDKSVKRKTVSEIMKNTDRNKFILMMDHQPDEFYEKNNEGVDLQVSGHTHAGQIFPTGLLIDTFHTSDLNYGCKVMSKLTAIVSSGVSGWGIPIRTEGHSEYVVINIKYKTR